MAPTPPSQARARAARCAFTIACVFIVLLAFAAGDATSIAELEQELVRWLTNHGAELNAKIQRDGSGNRRLVASKPLSKGDIIISLPPKLPFCASCGVGALGAGTKADVGRQLLLERNKGAASFYKPLLDVLPWEEHWMELPPPMTAELMPPEMLPLLQHPRLVRRSALQTRARARGVRPRVCAFE